MKTRLIFPNFVICLFLLALLPACNSVPTAVSGNLAPNPSFEEGENNYVSGWEGIHGEITYTWSEDIARSGEHSICISDLPAQRSADWNTSEHIPITTGTRYTFSTYAKGDFDREVYIVAFPIDADGNYMDGISVIVPFNHNEWTYADVSFTAPEGAVAVALDLGTNNPSDAATTGMICYDDVSFR